LIAGRIAATVPPGEAEATCPGGVTAMRIATALIFGTLVATPVMAQQPSLPKPNPEVCPEVYQPVCAKKRGSPKSYTNDCFARMDGAGDIKPGHCSPGQ